MPAHSRITQVLQMYPDLHDRDGRPYMRMHWNRTEVHGQSKHMLSNDGLVTLSTPC